MVFRIFAAWIAAFSLTSAAHADQVFNDRVIISDTLLCVGSSCTNGESPIASRQGLKINAISTAILFDDSTSPLSSNASRDWQINANEGGTGGREAFFITDVTSGSNPFWIEGGSSSNRFYLDSSGDLGLGTMFPEAELHLVANNTAQIRFETTLNQPSNWNLAADSSTFRLIDWTNTTTPITVGAGAPIAAFSLNSNGNIGMGVGAADGKLHTRGDGVQLIYFESGDGGPVQVRFRSDSQNRRFLATNNNNEVKTQVIFRDREILFTGPTDSGANRWMTVGPNGVLTKGPTCSSPCDLTFDPDVFTVPPIAERAEYMWDNMHLPAIGPTSPDAPINLTEKTGGIIHELEVAHIYIEQLHDRLEAQETRMAEMEAMLIALTAQ